MRVVREAAVSPIASAPTPQHVAVPASRRVLIRRQRAHVRYSVDLLIRFVGKSKLQIGRTENVSEGGLFVAIDLPVAVGTLTEFSLVLPEIDRILHLAGTVSWRRERSGSTGRRGGLGLRIESISPEQFAQVHQVLAIRGLLSNREHDTEET